jgi:type II secretory pathway component PulJ
MTARREDSHQQTRSGMTLIEILVASALGVMLIAMTWSAFLSAKQATMRTTSRVALHQTAAVLQETFERDFTALAPALAMFARSTPTVAGTTRSERIELVFMRSTAPLDKQSSEGTYDRYLADHHWVRWLFTRTLDQVGGTWKVTTASLKRSSSTPIRYWKTLATLVPAAPVWDPLANGNKASYNGVNWVNIPRPLRDARDGVASLDYNRYGVPAAKVSPDTPIGDIGDLADLTANEQILSSQVKDFLFGWVDAGGQAVSIDGQTAATVNVNGLYLDVVGPDNGRYLGRRQDPQATVPGPALAPGFPQYDYRPDLARRPRLARVSFRLEDQVTRVSQTFTFAVAAPGLMPPIRQPSP